MIASQTMSRTIVYTNEYLASLSPSPYLVVNVVGSSIILDAEEYNHSALHKRIQEDIANSLTDGFGLTLQDVQDSVLVIDNMPYVDRSGIADIYDIPEGLYYLIMGVGLNIPIRYQYLGEFSMSDGSSAHGFSLDIQGVTYLELIELS